jgi:hypothetical protein
MTLAGDERAYVVSHPDAERHRRIKAALLAGGRTTGLDLPRRRATPPPSATRDGRAPHLATGEGRRGLFILYEERPVHFRGHAFLTAVRSRATMTATTPRPNAPAARTC